MRVEIENLKSLNESIKSEFDKYKKKSHAALKKANEDIKTINITVIRLTNYFTSFEINNIYHPSIENR